MKVKPTKAKERKEVIDDYKNRKRRRRRRRRRRSLINFLSLSLFFLSFFQVTYLVHVRLKEPRRQAVNYLAHLCLCLSVFSFPFCPALFQLSLSLSLPSGATNLRRFSLKNVKFLFFFFFFFKIFADMSCHDPLCVSE